MQLRSDLSLDCIAEIVRALTLENTGIQAMLGDTDLWRGRKALEGQDVRANNKPKKIGETPLNPLA